MARIGYGAEIVEIIKAMPYDAARMQSERNIGAIFESTGEGGGRDHGDII